MKAWLPVALGVGAIVVLFSLAYFPSIQWMAGEWSAASGSLSHGYLVAAISAVLFVRAIPDVAIIPTRPAWWALPFLLGMSIVWLLAYVATVVAVQTLVLPAILITTIVAAYGLKAARPLAFPVFYIYFAIPAWEHLQFVFQAITVFVVSVLIRVVDIPALVSGNFVQLSTGTFEIAGGCSGLSFIMAGLSLAVLYGHFFYTRIRQKLALIIFALVVAMIGNWIRVFTIIVIGYKSDMQSPLVADHLTLGWILFGFLMVPVFFFARRIEDIHELTSAQDLRAVSRNSPAGERSWLSIFAAILAMSAGPLWALTVTSSDIEAEGLELALPAGTDHWTGPSESLCGWSPEFAGPDAERVAQYGSGEEFVLAYTNLYLTQSQDRELVYFSNRIGGAWRAANLENHVASTVRTAGGLEFRQVAASNYAGNWLIWYRYQINERFEMSDTRAKIAQAMEALQGRPEAGVIAFATPCWQSCEKAAERLQDFVDRVGYAVKVNYSRDVK